MSHGAPAISLRWLTCETLHLYPRTSTLILTSADSYDGFLILYHTLRILSSSPVYFEFVLSNAILLTRKVTGHKFG